MASSRFKVDVVDTGSCSSDKLQLRAALKNFCGNLGCTSDDQRVKVANDLFEFLLADFRLFGNFKTALCEDLTALKINTVSDQYFHVNLLVY